MAKTSKIRIFSALEVANICGVVNQTAINWIKNGYLKAFTTPGGQYRVYSEDLVDFLSSRNMRVPEELKKILDEKLFVDEALIVDDDKELNNMIAQFFEKKFPDMNVHQAYEGVDAGIMLTTIKPGLIILDIDLPGTDGIELCRKIRNNAPTAKSIVIAITGLDESVEEAIKDAGANEFMKKPLDFKKFQKVIETEIENTAKY
jgi:two-component system, OmpR family, response regulator